MHNKTTWQWIYLQSVLEKKKKPWKKKTKWTEEKTDENEHFFVL